ncbi:MAG: hypothetical protein AAFX87_00950 [Bacteroidota bacterium]
MRNESMNLAKSLLLFSLLSISPLALAQDNKTLTDFNENRQEINRKGMLVLGAWGLGNVLVSGAMLFRTDGIDKRFHTMNVGWGAINLTIAAFSYKAALNSVDGLTLSETLKEQNFIQQVLLFNAGLDLAYIATGFYLRERSLRFETGQPSKFENLRGFGNSLIMQGSFLFVFDLVMFMVHQNHRKTVLTPILDNITLSFNTVGVSFKF